MNERGSMGQVRLLRLIRDIFILDANVYIKVSFFILNKKPFLNKVLIIFRLQPCFVNFEKMFERFEGYVLANASERIPATALCFQIFKKFQKNNFQTKLCNLTSKSTHLQHWQLENRAKAKPKIHKPETFVFGFVYDFHQLTRP